jgi:hypothetical protein
MRCFCSPMRHRSEEGTLNQLITEPDLFIEAKRKDGVMVRNMLHIMLASNAEWNVPAGANERRYVIYDVSDKVMQNKVYFDALNEQLKNGGLNAMLFALLHWELKGFHPRQIPKPDASMAHQQLQTLLPLEAWWADLLETARPWGNSRDNPHLVISEGYDEVEEYCAGPGSMLPSTRRTKKRLCLYDQARASSPRLRNTNYNEIAAFLRKQGGVSRKVLGRRGWYLPPLQDCRRKWMEKYPAWEWQDKSITDWEPEVTEEPSSVKEADVSFRDAFEPKPPPLDPK